MPVELHFDRLPPLLPRYLRALTPRLHRSGDEITVPAISATARTVTADAQRVAAFASLLQQPASEFLPPTFPQVLAAPLHLSILTAPEFPLRASGLVHLANSITLLRPIPARAEMQLDARLVRPERTPRGIEMVMETTATLDGHAAWSSQSHFFARQPGGGRRDRQPRQPVDDEQEVATWCAAANTGRRYAAVSGDYNPIHLSALTARPFGFRAAIAHGMWTLGRTMAALDDRLDPPYEFTVRFRRPLLLPAEVRLLLGTGGRFRLVNIGTGKACLAGFYAEIQQ